MQPDAESRVRELLRDGKFADARSVLANRTDWFGLVERARLAYFLDHDLAGARELARRAGEVAQTHGQRLLAKALRSCARRPSATLVPFRREELADVEPQLRSEIVYYISCYAYQRGDLELARSWLSSHGPSEPAMRSRYLILQGVMAAAQEQFVEQASCLDAALEILESEAPEERYLIANAAHMLAVVVREVPFVSGLRRLEGLNAQLSDDDGFTGARVHVSRALGWHYAMRGDYARALHHIIRASTEAANDVQRMYAYLDHASVSIFAGEHTSVWAKAYFRLAADCAKRIKWGGTLSDDVAALPLAAQVAAELGEAKDARRFCRLAQGRRGHVAARFALAHDGRLAAFCSEAIALTYISSMQPSSRKAGAGVQERARALREAEAAYETFARIGYAWRAGRMAILLHQASRQPVWRQRAEAHLASYPGSPFHRLIESGTTGLTLTLRQTEVLRYARLGKSNEEIAKKLRLSPNTVRVHLGRVFRFYDVESRAELIAKLSQATSKPA